MACVDEAQAIFFVAIQLSVKWEAEPVVKSKEIDFIVS